MITRSRSETPPVTGDITDPYGNVIRPGCVVAYNYQGELRGGVVESVSGKWSGNGTGWWFFHADIKIARGNCEGEGEKNHISTVKNPNGVLVIRASQTPTAYESYGKS